MRKTVEETPNALLDKEASELVGAGRYERTAGREAHRGGHYARKLVTGARYRRCTVHFYRNVLGRVPVTRRKAVAHMLEPIHAQ